MQLTMLIIFSLFLIVITGLSLGAGQLSEEAANKSIKAREETEKLIKEFREELQNQYGQDKQFKVKGPGIEASIK